MSVLIIIFSAVAILVALFYISALFVPKNYSFEREIVIDRPVQQVYDYVRHIRNQDHYSKWVMADPGMKKEFRGTDGQVGFVYVWDSEKKAGKGEQEIVSLVPNERVDAVIRFEKPMKAVANAPMGLTAVSGSQTRVRWGMNGTSKYPMNMMYFMMGGALAKDLDTSLARLKSNLENQNG